MATYRTGDFRKGLKVQIDGEPYLMSEMNFRKPGKGNAIYECTLKNLIRGTTLKKVYRGGDELESADVEEVPCTYLYKQGETYFFMNTKNFEQYELSQDQLDDTWKYLKDGLAVSVLLFNNLPISMTPPPHVELKVEYCEPGRPRRHGHQRDQAGEGRNRRRDPGPAVHQHRQHHEGGHAHRRVHRAGFDVGAGFVLRGRHPQSGHYSRDNLEGFLPVVRRE